MRLVTCLSVSLAALSLGCATAPVPPTAPAAPEVAAAPAAPEAPALPAAPSATATIEARSGSKVTGSVAFTADATGKTRVVIKLAGLAPGEHGLHLHETGDCSAPDGSSAGGHWNPMSMQHGGPASPPHHAGDLGNVVADASGNVDVTLNSTDFTLAGPMSVVHHSVVVHEKADDLKSQPSGASGARVGCGVVAQ